MRRLFNGYYSPRVVFLDNVSSSLGVLLRLSYFLRLRNVKLRELFHLSGLPGLTRRYLKGTCSTWAINFHREEK